MGLLGPNGAGKSTLLSIIATVRRPDSGCVTYGGIPSEGMHLSDVRSRLGYLPQHFDLMNGASCRDNVSYAAWCNATPAGMADLAAVQALKMVHLTGKSRDKVRTLSGGERQRLGIACAVAHSPSIVLLDEPTSGLDPAQRIDVREHLVSIAASACVLVSTHLVEDLVAMQARILVMNSGQLAFQGSLRQLVAPGRAVDIEAVERAYLGLVRT
jgi:ABC-2 type transport system ATP-binding protein